MMMLMYLLLLLPGVFCIAPPVCDQPTMESG